MPSLPISELTPLNGAALATNDLLAVVDNSASETKNIRVDQLVIGIAPKFPPNSIPGTAVDSQLGPDSVGTIELQNGSVTAVKLADNSSTLVGARPAAGDHIGQICVDESRAYVWTGDAWAPFSGANAILDVQYEAGPIVFTTRTVDGVVLLTTDFLPTNDAAQFLAGPTTAGGPVTYRTIVGDDLPLASATESGVIKVNGDGLAMDGDKLVIDNAIVPSNGAYYLVDYNEKGLVIGSRAIQSSDLPLATADTPGIAKPGTGLTVDASGAFNHAPYATPGVHTKVTVSSEGHVIGQADLEPDDIPDLDASKIISGTFDPDRIADESISGLKLEDYSTCLMQEDFPGPGDFLGQFWYTPSTAQLRVYARGSGPENIWLPVGFGVLAQQNLRVGFTYDAATATIITATSYGTIAGLNPGDSIPNPTDELIGIYGVCVTPGNSITVPNLTGTVHTAGDWILCLGETEGWVHIDVTSNGGGGGGAQVLNDLLDVIINDGTIDTVDLDPIPAVALEDGQLLKYRASDGMWRNSNIIDCGSF